MPAWNAQANDIFAKAIEVTELGQRDAYLDEACAGDAELRSAVARLLRAHESAGDFLMQPPPGLQTAITAPSIGECPGAEIGRYRLIEEIGQGGFGVVYRAKQQQPLRREVALKIIKVGMDTKEVVGRFEAERQALAMMEHPHIAKVLDAGATETGRPYFVMELVEGLPITEFCDAQRWETHERLKLFVDVCRAVQHAHQKGIIHRDLKPSNVMVSRQDGKAVPKVIDFGVAKATQQRLTEKTVFTAERQLIGTPEYMSPEQASFGDADIDTRSDVYSLGVLLYELLVGTTPFDARDLRSRSYDEICRVIRESDPPTPSRRLSTLGAGVEEVSQNRHVPPSVLNKLLRGDLDCVVMKALEKDRQRRYETADALAEDIRRHLANLPVVARPPTLAYQLTKFVRKHRGPVAAAASMVAVLLIATVSSTVLYWRAEQQRKRADANAVEIAAQSEQTRQALYVSDINSAYQAFEKAELWRVRALLDRHVPTVDEEDLRGFEWHFLQGLWDYHANAPSLKQDGRGIGSMALSADGNLLATSTRRAIWLWDMDQRKLIQTIDAPGQEIGHIAFSKDSTMLASCGRDRAARVWDVSSGKMLQEMPHEEEYVDAVMFTEDGRRLITGCGSFGQGVIHIWDIATGSSVAELRDHQARVVSLARLDGRSQLVSASWDRTLKIWDLKTHRALHTLQGHVDRVLAVAISPTGNELASADKDGRVMLWNVSGEGEPVALEVTYRFCTSLAYSSDNRYLAAACEDGTVHVCDTVTRDTVAVLPNPGQMNAVAFTADSRTLLCAGANAAVRIVDISSFGRQKPAIGHGDWITRLAPSPDGRQLAVGYGELSTQEVHGDLYVWDRATGRFWRPTPPDDFPIYDVAFSARDNLVAAAFFSGDIGVWNSQQKRLVWRNTVYPIDAMSVAFSPDAKRLATGSWGPPGLQTRNDTAWASNLKLLDAANGAVQFETDLFRFGIVSIAFSPDGQTIAVAGGQWGAGRVKVFDAAGNPEATFKTSDLVFKLAFSPDGSRLAAADHAGWVSMWVMPEGRQLASLRHSNQLHGLDFSPDGKTLASASREGTVRLWHVATGDQLATLAAGGQIYSVTFLDSQTLAAGSADRRIFVWMVGEDRQVLYPPGGE